MDNYIKFQKIWEDDELMELKVECQSDVAWAMTNIYASSVEFNSLTTKLSSFLEGSIEKFEWVCGKRGKDTTPCLILTFIKKDKWGHIIVDVYMELNDGDDTGNHNCSFYVKTELGALYSLRDKCRRIQEFPLYYEVII